MISTDPAYIRRFKRNLKLPILKVKHKDLTRSSEDSMFKSVCPKCKEPGLFVTRDQETLKLLNDDLCMNCGRRFYYTDIISNIVLIYHDESLDKLQGKNLFPEKLKQANKKLKKN